MLYLNFFSQFNEIIQTPGSQSFLQTHLGMSVLKVSTVYFLLGRTWLLTTWLFFFKWVYLFIFRERGREGERETSVCGCLSCTSYWGPGPQPRHVSWLGLKRETLWFAGQCSIHRATPARAPLGYFKTKFKFLALKFFHGFIKFVYRFPPLG